MHLSLSILTSAVLAALIAARLVDSEADQWTRKGVPYLAAGADCVYLLQAGY